MIPTRKMVWASRAVLSSVPAGVAYWLSTVTVRRKHIWFWSVHNVLTGLLTILGFAMMIIAAFVAAVFVIWVGSWTLHALFRSARRREFKKLGDWW